MQELQDKRYGSRQVITPVEGGEEHDPKAKIITRSGKPINLVGRVVPVQ